MSDVRAIEVVEDSGINLDPKRNRALAVVLLAPSLEAAARELGVTVKTLRRWMDDPAFNAAMKHVSRQVLDLAIHRIVCMADKAVSTLLDVMDDPNNPAYVRSRAAADVLGAVVRLRGLQNNESRMSDIEEKLEGLELGGHPRWQRN